MSRKNVVLTSVIASLSLFFTEPAHTNQLPEHCYDTTPGGQQENSTTQINFARQCAIREVLEANGIIGGVGFRTWGVYLEEAFPDISKLPYQYEVALKYNPKTGHVEYYVAGLATPDWVGTYNIDLNNPLKDKLGEKSNATKLAEEILYYFPETENRDEVAVVMSGNLVWFTDSNGINERYPESLQQDK